MLTRLVYFVVAVIIALLIGWLLLTIIDILPFIPEALRAVLHVIIWVFVAIAILLYSVNLFRGTLPPMTPP